MCESGELPALRFYREVEGKPVKVVLTAAVVARAKANARREKRAFKRGREYERDQRKGVASG